MRKEEFFTKNVLKENKSVSQVPPILYKQERDWTCAIACIRTLISAINEDVPTEEYFIEKYNLKPGPLYSNDVMNLKILEKYNVKYGCLKDIDFNEIVNLLNEGYYIMLESMVNYSHWMVLLGYFAVSEDIEQYKLLFFDPYYEEVRLIRADEFIGMWQDGDGKIKHDFIAIK